MSYEEEDTCHMRRIHVFALHQTENLVRLYTLCVSLAPQIASSNFVDSGCGFVFRARCFYEYVVKTDQSILNARQHVHDSLGHGRLFLMGFLLLPRGASSQYPSRI